MYRFLFILIVPLFLLAAPVVQASSLYDEKSEYDRKLESIMKEIDRTEERTELIALTQKENEIASFQRAYEKAIEYVSDNKNPVMYLTAGSSELQYKNLYMAAADKYNIDWTLLAAIHDVETNFSTHPTMISSAGAQGHMQFMPATWDYYGVDASGDGKADPYNLKDAIYSAANYLAATGAAEGMIEDALFAYNRSTAYVQEVIGLANAYKEGYSNDNVPVVEVGKKFISN